VLVLLGGLGCGGSALVDDDDDAAPTPVQVPDAPASSSALEDAIWWGNLLLGAGREAGRCLAVQNDGAVALGLCDLGNGRGFTYEARTLVDEDGLCLQGGSPVRVEACDGGPAQEWIHDPDGRLRTFLPGDDTWACLQAETRTQAPSVRRCDDRLPLEQRWAVDHQSPSVPVAKIVGGLGALRVPVELDPVGAVSRRATPLLFSEEGTPVIVAGTAGSGRVVALGARNAIQGNDTSDTWGLFWGRLLTWLGDENPVVAMGPGATGASWLRDLGMTVAEDVDIAVSTMAGIGIYVVGDGDGVTDREREATHEFLRDGGGLLLARGALPADAFTAIHPTNEYRTASAAAPAGIGWTWSDGNGAATDVDITPDPAPSPFHNLQAALESAARAEQDLEDLDLATWQALRFESASAATAGTDLPPFSRLGAATDALRRELGGLDITSEAPLRFSSGQLPDLVLRGDYVLTGALREGDRRIHESAGTFPGPLPESSETDTAEVAVDTRAPLVALRRSTGLYALPGTSIAVTTTAWDAGLRVRIGAVRLDTMPGVGAANPEETPRFPRVWTGRRLDRAEVRLTSAFGGPIYIDVPEGDGVGVVDLEIAGAARMPRFVHGETTDDDWVDAIRDLPGARAEIGSERFILTGPSELLRLLDAPSALAQQLDAMVAAHETFVGLTESARTAAEALPHRLVADPRLLTGLQAGRPMEMAEAWTRGLIFADLQLGNETFFELLRALGTTYRRGVWSPGPWRGALSALAASYAFEEATGLALAEAWQGNLNALSRQLRREEWLDGEAGGWSADLETGLELFLLVRDEFGWDPILAVIADLRALTAEARPGDDEAKLHEWIVRLSTETGVDVVGLFQAWRFPIDEATLTSTDSLPEWGDWPRI
jgi:hypothetical protein